MALTPIQAIAVAKGYTDETVIGGGAIKGKNCVVDSIENITGGHRVNFKWTLDDGTEKTGYMDVLDGAPGQDGADGLGIKSVAVDASNHLVVTYDDDTTHDAGEIQGGGESSDIPSYYQTEFATTKASVENHSTNDSYNILAMFDLHFSSEGSNYYESQLRTPLFTTIRALKKFAAEVPTDMILLGGDYMQMPDDNTKEMGISNLAEINQTFDEIGTPFFPIEGNHEANYKGDGTGSGLTQDEVYRYLVKKWVGRNGVKKVSTSTFYRMDDVNGVCHVFVSTFTEYATSAAITADFASVVAANTNNYPYIIYNHFGNKADGVEDGVKTSIDYIRNTLGKTIIAWISGHRHYDWVRVYNNTLVVTLLNSGYWMSVEGQDGQTYSKTANTSSESVFSVLTFVPTTGKLFVTRFGAGVDMECNYNTTSGAVGRVGYTPTPTTYTVTQTLSGAVSSSNSSSSASGGDSYTTTLSVPDAHFTFGTVTVTMGGVDITSTAYDSTTHVVSIASVSGDIIITATATNDYPWTVVDATVAQHNSSAQCTYEKSGNNISETVTLANSGLNITADLKQSITTETKIKVSADNVNYTYQSNEKILPLAVELYNNNNTRLGTCGIVNPNTTARLEDLTTGITVSISWITNYQTTTKMRVVMRTDTTAELADLPASVSLENLRIELTT